MMEHHVIEPLLVVIIRLLAGDVDLPLPSLMCVSYVCKQSHVLSAPVSTWGLYTRNRAYRSYPVALWLLHKHFLYSN